MAQWVKSWQHKPDDLNPTFRTHVKGNERTNSTKASLASTYTLWHTSPYTPQQTHIHTKFKNFRIYIYILYIYAQFVRTRILFCFRQL